ncbi:hypothetical protein [Halioxenophilus aromaticivorans]|uniref:DUF4410 domain-containing protein n=1 Tax=Halioxenophilus aromaticivorans TaxID=1306992 RepID=A0AAV3U137_9ALTE
MNFRPAAIISLSFMLFGLLSGCATQVTETPAKPMRSSVPFSEFENVVLVEAELAPPYTGQGANEKAAKKINEVLLAQVTQQLNNVKAVSLADFASNSYDKTSTPKTTLIIKPLIKQIKFIGGAARFWGGAMAGSSVVVMDTIFIDAATGEQIGVYGNYRKAGAYTDAFGIQSNVMLHNAAEDVGMYISANL